MTAHVATLLVSVLSLGQGELRVVFDRPLDETFHIRVTQAPGSNAATDRMSIVQVLLIERAAPRRTWELASLPVREDQIVAVERATARVLVLYWRSDRYGVEDGYLKLFLDLKAKRLSDGANDQRRICSDVTTPLTRAARQGITDCNCTSGCVRVT